jgi:ATP/maltotriose-dependent transcriptional regulator MalT
VVLTLAQELEATANAGGPSRQTACAALHHLYPNVQVALRWCLERKDPEMALSLARTVHFVWTARTPPSEGLAWLTQVLELAGSSEATPARAMAYVTAGRLATQQGSYAQARAFFTIGLPLARQAGDFFVLMAALQLVAVDSVDRGAYAEGRVCLDEALALARARRDPLQVASCMNNLLWAACLQGDYTNARRWSEEAIPLARMLGDDWTLSWSLQGLGFAACAQGDLTTAHATLAESERLFQQVDELYGMAWTHDGLGHVALAEHEQAEAQMRFVDALVLRQELGDLPGIADCLEGIGGLLAVRKRLADAVCLAGAAEALRETLELPLGPMRRDLRDRWLEPVRLALDEAAMATAWSRGRRLPAERAVAFARSALETGLPAPVARSPLTHREEDVAALVASGLSNRQIAERLVIAERTAATHIEHILAKLDFTSRTQIGIWAAEHGFR